MVILSEHPEVMAVHGLCGAARDAVARAQDLQRRRDEAVWLGIVGDVDRSGSYLDDSHRTAACWVVAVTNCAKAVAARQVRTARMFHHLPLVAAALYDGHIGSTQVEQLLRLWSNPRVRDALAVLEVELVERASLMPPDDFQQVCDMIRLFADPDGAHRDHQSSRDNRHLSIVPDGAGFRLHAEGDALSGALFEETLARYTQTEFDADWAAGKAAHGDRMCPALLQRTNRQRRFDAFIAMIRAAANANAANGLVPLVTIHCDQRTAEEIIREHFATQDATTDATDDDTFDDDGATGDDAFDDDDSVSEDGDGDGDGDSDDGDGDGDESGHGDRIDVTAFGWSNTDLSSHAHAPRRPITDPDDLLRRRCHTRTGAPVDRDDLLIAMLIGRIRTVIHGHDQRVIALGHT
ncbi:MAG: hypothetical protein JWN39_2739, partial [Ilumatobacteraceae bacterium]|nr:hypothetical protein [Ilumatobacteraceae bacterium]